ncbi:hypothetical protein EVG20_g8484 [Dentipellis fragilis]|uniref:HMG box domain-containing protein n=1 Tax=Dentipellis fragilis TaxID=205917 RepID=A0A4Y9Y609_9AGAM|nr:hypothetical protein EVG20_g8484 [Dentipellis fragilis]
MTEIVGATEYLLDSIAPTFSFFTTESTPPRLLDEAISETIAYTCNQEIRQQYATPHIAIRSQPDGISSMALQRFRRILGKLHPDRCHRSARTAESCRAVQCLSDLLTTTIPLFYILRKGLSNHTPVRRVASADAFVLAPHEDTVPPGHLPTVWARALADFRPGRLALFDWTGPLPVPGMVILLAPRRRGDYSKGLPSHNYPARWTRQRRQDAIRSYKDDAGYALDASQLSRGPPPSEAYAFNDILPPFGQVPGTLALPGALPERFADSPSPATPSDSNSSSSPPQDISDLPSSNFPSKRVSRKGPNHIPRPPNAFIIFRSDFLEKQKDLKDIERDHRHVSRIAANTWRLLSDEERSVYKKKAEEEKRIHEARYPGYRFSPSRQREKHKRVTKRNGLRDKIRAQCIAHFFRKDITGAELRAEVEKLDIELDVLYGPKEGEPSGSEQLPSLKAREEEDAPPFRSPLLAPAPKFVDSHPSSTGQLRLQSSMYLPVPESPPMASLQAPVVPPLSLATPSAFRNNHLPSDSPPPPPVTYYPTPYAWPSPVSTSPNQLQLPSPSYGSETASTSSLWSPIDTTAPQLDMSAWQNAPADPHDLEFMNFLNIDEGMDFWNNPAN